MLMQVSNGSCVLPLWPVADRASLQASDAPEEEPVPLAPARSPFQKPSVQVMSLSDDAFEAAPAQVIPVASSRCPCCWMSTVPCPLDWLCSELTCDSGIAATHAEPGKGRGTSGSCAG